jgi:hypothetical protein
VRIAVLTSGVEMALSVMQSISVGTEVSGVKLMSADEIWIAAASKTPQNF